MYFLLTCLPEKLILYNLSGSLNLRIFGAFKSKIQEKQKLLRVLKTNDVTHGAMQLIKNI